MLEWSASMQRTESKSRGGWRKAHCAAATLSRRDLLGVAGLVAPALLPGIVPRPARGEGGDGPGFGRAKRCIFLFMWGGPSHLDTFDPKPEAPAEVRGEFGTTATSVPGLRISEHFRHMASRMDRVALIRSLTHDDPSHLASAHCTLTGHLAPVPKSDAVPPSDRDTPHLGSVTARWRPARGGLPAFVTMPWLAYHPAAPGGKAPGQNGGWLGHRYDPLLVEGDPSRPGWSVPALQLRSGLTLKRLENRRLLLNTLDRQVQPLLERPAARGFDEQQQRAFAMLVSPQVRRAFDLQAEPPAVRDRYGRNIHGQCVLLARRLVEHGVPFVSVNWHNDGRNFWDTHGNNFNRLKNDLIPPADQALAALLDDLQSRGMLEDTLVCWVGEFGRKPQITKGNAGREHWPFCYCGLLAGAGVAGGAIHGRSDAQGGYPEEFPVSPHDFAATVLHALGIPPETTWYDREQRPHRLYAGTPVTTLFG
ncbi:MAG: DUF1501 domain-containing protein [Planctomycetota bacterium]|nr:MAG: DUF1501 domain-containing protein [Planctomycetota bacterium]